MQCVNINFCILNKQISTLIFLYSLLHMEQAHKVAVHQIVICTMEINDIADNHHHKNWLEKANRDVQIAANSLSTPAVLALDTYSYLNIPL